MSTLTMNQTRRKQAKNKNQSYLMLSLSMKKLGLSKCTIKWLNCTKMLRKCNMIHEIFITLNYLLKHLPGSIHHHLSFSPIFITIFFSTFATSSQAHLIITATTCLLHLLFQLAISSLETSIISFFLVSLLQAFMRSIQEPNIQMF